MKRSAKQSSTLDGRGRSANLGQPFNLTGTDSVSNLVRRAEHRRRQSSDWRKTVGKIEAALGLNTEHKACPRLTRRITPTATTPPTAPPSRGEAASFKRPLERGNTSGGFAASYADGLTRTTKRGKIVGRRLHIRV